MTLFDSLDTMWIMGLHEEFSEAVLSVKDWRFNNITKVGVFLYINLMTLCRMIFILA